MFNLNTELKHGALSFGVQVRYIGEQVLNEYEDFFIKQGRPPENADYADRQYYTDIWYEDIRLGLDVNDKFNIYAGVDNVSDKVPPLGLTGTGGGSGIYNSIGRYFYAGFKANY